MGWVYPSLAIDFGLIGLLKGGRIYMRKFLLAVGMVMALPTFAMAQDAANGESVFKKCKACHGLDGKNKVGPNLHGVIGRKAGLAPGFAYSDPMTASEVVWSAETLDKFLLRPSDFIPGTRMVFVGLRKPEDRASVIAYLQQETGAAE